MNIDRYMVTLFFEIKRNLPHELQPDLKISDPKIGERMMQLYHDVEDENIRLLTEIFLERAGGEWKKNLRKKIQRKKALVIKTIDEPISKTADLTVLRQLNHKTRIKPKRIYRGQPVYD